MPRRTETYFSSLEFMILFSFKLFSDDAWEKQQQNKTKPQTYPSALSPLGSKRLPGNQRSHHIPELGGEVFVRMAFP